MGTLRINVKDFSKTPGARYRDEGKFSGEEFREEYLEKIFKEALENKQELIVDIDGTIGYGTSWLEEVFGGLARKFGKDKVLKTIDFVSKEEPYLVEDIEGYIKNA